MLARQGLNGLRRVTPRAPHPYSTPAGRGLIHTQLVKVVSTVKRHEDFYAGIPTINSSDYSKVFPACSSHSREVRRAPAHIRVPRGYPSRCRQASRQVPHDRAAVLQPRGQSEIPTIGDSTDAQADAAVIHGHAAARGGGRGVNPDAAVTAAAQRTTGPRGWWSRSDQGHDGDVRVFQFRKRSSGSAGRSSRISQDHRFPQITLG